MNTHVEGVIVNIQSELKGLENRIRLLLECLKVNHMTLPSQEEVEKEIEQFMHHSSLLLVRAYLHEQLYDMFTNRLTTISTVEELMAKGLKLFLTPIKTFVENLENHSISPIIISSSGPWKNQFINSAITHDVINKLKAIPDGCDKTGNVIDLKKYEKYKKELYKNALDDLQMCFDTLSEEFCEKINRVLKKPITLLKNQTEEGYQGFDVYSMGSPAEGDFIIKSAGDVRAIEWEQGISSPNVSVRKKLNAIVEFESKKLSKKSLALLESLIKSLE